MHTLHTYHVPLSIVPHTDVAIFLDKDSSVTMHQQNLGCLAIEMFKINNKLSPPFICDLIQESTCRYHTRSHFTITETENGTITEEKNVMSIPKANKVKMGIESFSFIGPKLWNQAIPKLIH